jgi:hypothetical protein
LHFKKLECPSEKAFHFQNAAQSLDQKKTKTKPKKKVYISNNHFQNVAQAMEEKICWAICSPITLKKSL